MHAWVWFGLGVAWVVVLHRLTRRRGPTEPAEFVSKGWLRERWFEESIIRDRRT